MKQSTAISIIIPVFKSSKTIAILSSRIKETLLKITDNYEIIFVDDFCPENSWKEIIFLSKNDSRIKGIKLTKNFGQHYAITAGLTFAKGEWIIIMDCDLQDDPKNIIALYEKAKISSCKVIFARRKNRKDNFLKKKTSYFFYKILSYLTGATFDASVANFGIFKKEVVKQYLNLNDRVRVFSIMIRLLGYTLDYIEVDHNDRKLRKSSYNLKKRLRLAFDIILSFSNRPLNLIMKMGFYTSLISFFFALYTISRYLNGDIHVSGYTSILVSIWFLFGLIVFFLGFIGLYIGNIFDSVKNRPIYVIDKTSNFADI